MIHFNKLALNWKVFLRHWHGEILQGLAFDARAKMTTDYALPKNGSAGTQDVPSSVENHPTEVSVGKQYISFGAEGHTTTFTSNGDTTDETSTLKTIPRRTNSCTSASSQQRVTEWMRQNENLSDDTFDPGPPPLLPKPQVM